MSHLLLGVLSNVGDVHKDSHICHLGLGRQTCQYSWRAAACKTKSSGFGWWHAILVAVTESLAMPMSLNPQEMMGRVVGSAGH